MLMCIYNSALLSVRPSVDMRSTMDIPSHNETGIIVLLRTDYIALFIQHQQNKMTILPVSFSISKTKCGDGRGPRVKTRSIYTIHRNSKLRYFDIATFDHHIQHLLVVGSRQQAVTRLQWSTIE